MLKKVVLGTLFAGLVAVLVIGAINRTNAKREDSSQSAGRGRGQNQTVQEIGINQGDRDLQGGGRGNGNGQANGSGQGNGGGRSTAENSKQYPNYQEAIDEWFTYDGIVTQVPAEGIDLVIETDEGELVVGTGPLSLAELGIEVLIGDVLEVRGYWEGDELKAAQITQPATGQTVALRDEWGRPVWSGSGQNSRGAQNEFAENDRDGNAASGTTGQGIGWGGNGGRNGTGREITPAVGQAEVNEWITLQGHVTSADESALVIRMSSGEVVTVENRPWWFAQEQGFSAAVGDEVALTGFFEGEEFETGQLANITANLVIEIRQENGRPLWAGGGRQG